MQELISVCKDNRELSLLLKSPVIKADKKLAILTEIFTGFSTLSKSFISIITTKNEKHYRRNSTSFYNRLQTTQRNSVSSSYYCYPIR